MKYLLDTHVILWWLTEPEKIPDRVKNIIQDRTHNIYLSAVSFWEMAIKQSIGRLVIPKNILEILLQQKFEILNLTPEEGLGVSDLPLLHPDPFDRILIIQAKLNNMVLVSRDQKLALYPVTTMIF